MRPRGMAVVPALAILALVVMLASIRWGAVPISLRDMLAAVGAIGGDTSSLPLDQRIFLSIRVPRALLTVLVGGSLALGGVLMQALFRNPIVEPGLVGTSSGAAFGAALYFVVGAAYKVHTGPWTLPLAASIGAALATWLVFTLARLTRSGVTTVGGLLLTGIAINALFMGGVGFLSYIARDPQARSITFWNLGTMSGASWTSVIIVGISTTLCSVLALREARALDALLLGDEEAQYLGVDVRAVRRRVLAINVVLIAVATAFTGVIAFVGLIVPHLLRLLGGSANRYLMLGSICLGAALLSAADLVARLTLAPAELPIGIVTSLVGVPVFLILLRRRPDVLG